MSNKIDLYIGWLNQNIITEEIFRDILNKMNYTDEQIDDILTGRVMKKDENNKED